MAGLLDFYDDGLEVPCVPVRPISPQFSAVLAEIESEEVFTKKVACNEKQLPKVTPVIEITEAIENKLDVGAEDSDPDPIAISYGPSTEVTVNSRSGNSKVSNRSSSDESHNTINMGKVFTNEQRLSRDYTKKSNPLISNKSAFQGRRDSSPAALEKFRSQSMSKDSHETSTRRVRPRLAKSQSEKEIIDLRIDVNNNAKSAESTPNKMPGHNKEVWLSPLLQRRSKSSTSLPSLDPDSHESLHTNPAQSSAGLRREDKTFQPHAPLSPRSQRRHMPSNTIPGSKPHPPTSPRTPDASPGTSRRHPPASPVSPTLPKPPGSPKPTRPAMRSPIMSRPKSANPLQPGNHAEKPGSELTVNESPRGFRRRAASSPCVSPILSRRRASISPNISPEMSPEVERKFQAFARSLAQSPRRNSHAFESLTPFATSIIDQASEEADTEGELPKVSMADVLKTWHVNNDKDSVRLLSHIGLRDRGWSVPVFKIDESLTECRYLRRRSDNEDEHD